VGQLPVIETDYSCIAVDARIQKYIYENNKMEGVSGEFRSHCRAKFYSRDSFILCLL